MGTSNLLVFHPGALGDVILLFPALRRLESAHGTVDIICQSGLGKLAAHLKRVDRFFPLEAAFFASLFAGDLHPRALEILGGYRILVLITFSEQLATTIRRGVEGRVIRISPRPRANQRIHVTDHVLSNLTEQGVLPPTSDRRRMNRQETPQRPNRSAGADPLKIWIQPGSGSPKKNWPLEYFLQAAAALRAKGMRPVFLVGPAEQQLEAVLQKNGCPFCLTEGLVQLADQLPTAGGYIGNDSGVTHLAAHVGLPTVAVFGPTDPTRWSPVGPAVRTLTSETSCSPCFETGSLPCDHRDCLVRITPDKVVDALFQMIR